MDPLLLPAWWHDKRHKYRNIYGERHRENTLVSNIEDINKQVQMVLHTHWNVFRSEIKVSESVHKRKVKHHRWDGECSGSIVFQFNLCIEGFHTDLNLLPRTVRSIVGLNWTPASLVAEQTYCPVSERVAFFITRDGDATVPPL